MEKNTFSVSKRTKDYTDKKTGEQKTMKLVVMTFANGVELEVASSRFNYRAFDYLNDLVKGGE